MQSEASGWLDDKTDLAFNVQGDYVVLASEPISIVGVDVAAPQQLRMRGSQQKMSIAELRSVFSKQFTAFEVHIWATSPCS